MVTKDGRAASDKENRGDDWPHLISFGTLLAAVVGVLLLGAVLRTDLPETDAGAATTDPPLQHRPQLHDEELDGLAQRLQDDVARLRRVSDEWTTQLGLFCDPLRARELFDRFGDLAAFHILPSLHGDRACYRICWGQYGTAAEAKAARDLPQSVREILPAPLPKLVAEILE